VPPIDPTHRADMVRLLELGWRPDAVAEQLHVSRATVYNTERNLTRYGQPIRPHVRKAGRPAALTKADREALLKLLLYNSWKYLDEI
jgi:transposase